MILEKAEVAVAATESEPGRDDAGGGFEPPPALLSFVVLRG